MKRLRAGRRTRTVEARGAFAAPEGFDTLVTAGFSLSGPVAIWSTSAGEATLNRRWDEFRHEGADPTTTPAASSDVVIATYRGSTTPTAVAFVPALPVQHPRVDVLPDQSFLVVGARCEWRKSGPELNALVIDRNGQILRRGCLGDGIQHLQVARDGTIWTGYSDEGVYGNLGWGGPGPTPLGAAGIVAWSSTFEKLWELDVRENPVDDCYSLNVAGDEVLSCPYSDFPVIRITQTDVHVVPTRKVAGPKGIVARGDEVALIGSYRDPSLLVRGFIEDGRFRETERSHLRAPDGRPLPTSEVHCRGSVAHFIAGCNWFTFDLAGAS